MYNLSNLQTFTWVKSSILETFFQLIHKHKASKHTQELNLELGITQEPESYKKLGITHTRHQSGASNLLT